MSNTTTQNCAILLEQCSAILKGFENNDVQMMSGKILWRKTMSKFENSIINPLKEALNFLFDLAFPDRPISI